MEREERKQDVYPYAQPKTHEFLLAAIAEDAHKKIPLQIRWNAERKYYAGKARLIKGIYNPGDLSDQELADALWVRMRNIAGARFASPATFKELGVQYGFANHRPSGREWSRQLTKKFVTHLWENCSEETRQKFPISQLSIKRPHIIRRPTWRTPEVEGTVISQVNKGKTLKEISKDLGIGYGTISNILDSKGIRTEGQIKLAFTKRLSARLRKPPENPVLRQRLLKMVASTTLYRDRDLLATLKDTCREADLKGFSGSNLELISQYLRDHRIAVAYHARRGDSKVIQTYHYFFKDDLPKAVEALKGFRIDSKFKSRLATRALVEQMENPPEDFGEKQHLLSRLGRSRDFHRKFRYLFATAHDLFHKNGLPYPRNCQSQIIEQLKSLGVPLVTLENGQGQKTVVTLRSELERIKIDPSSRTLSLADKKC